MTTRATQLFDEAMRLPEVERADLVSRLLESLESDTAGVDDEEWEAEILRRVEEIRLGKSAGVPWPEARRMILDDN